MRKRFARSIVVLAVGGLLSGLLVTPAHATHEDVCTPAIAPHTITVAGQDVPIPGRPRRCYDIPTESLPGANVYQDDSGAWHVVVTNTGSYSSTCMFGIDGNCLVWLDLQ